MTYDSAVDRCAANGKEQCTPRSYAGSICNVDINRNTWSSWTASSCMTRVKISYETGMIGRVDYPEPDYAGLRNVAKAVDDSTKNFFNVAWLSKPTLIVDSASCNAIPSCYSVDDGCVCDTSLAETAVFGSSEAVSSKEAALSTLHVGAFAPDMFDTGYIVSHGNCGVEGVEFYSRSSSDSCSNLGKDAFLGVVDNHGVQRHLKNIRSIVEIVGVNASFRNVPHFISMVDQDLRDMYYETDAVIDHFFHHPSHAPFLAIRIIQRFGISNPSPGFIERVATAYVNGLYNGIGSGSYGDLSAM